tara:strand:+ start:333 stop:434 length:102 start_codon:yes stop_codon:yes gene_type:complete
MIPPEGAENVQKGSYGCDKLNKHCYKKVDDYLD